MMAVPEKPHSAGPNKALVWTGRVLSTLVILFFLMDAVMKFFKPEIVVKTTMELGYSESFIVPLGTILLCCTILYAIPPTAVLGAILLTGYLGGAITTHIIHRSPLATHILFPVYFGVVVWLGLFLREPRLWALIPLRCSPTCKKSSSTSSGPAND